MSTAASTSQERQLSSSLPDLLLPSASLSSSTGRASSIRRKPVEHGGTSLLGGKQALHPRPVLPAAVPAPSQRDARLGGLPAARSNVTMVPTAANLKRQAVDDDEERGVFAMDIDDDDDVHDSTGAARPTTARQSSAPPSVGAPATPLVIPEPARAKSHPTAPPRRAADHPHPEKKPRRSGSSSTMSTSAPTTPLFGPAGTPLLGPVAAPRGTPLLGPAPTPRATPLLGPQPSPKISPKISPATSLVSLEADLQPRAMLRAHEFRSGRRIFHVHFGPGFVRSLDAPPELEPAAAASQQPSAAPEISRSSSQSQNINVHFDNPKYKSLRLRAFYAVPKMVVIPSSAALRRQKLQQVVDSTPPLEQPRTTLVRSLLAAGSVRAACSLVLRWRLQHAFAPMQLLERLLGAKCYAAAVRFARDFGVSAEIPAHEVLARMLREKHYDGALKQTNVRSASVDGQVSPVEVLTQMVDEGRHAIALKYVHKFGASARFPPEKLVSSCLSNTAELSVRTCALLLKYVRVFGLETTYPMPQLLERVAAAGVTVHEMDGKFVLKGRRRQSISQPGVSASAGASPQPGTSPTTSTVGAARSAPI